MVDDFMVCVDRLIASLCFEPVNERGSLLRSGNGNTPIVGGADAIQEALIVVSGSDLGYSSSSNGVITEKKTTSNSSSSVCAVEEGCSSGKTLRECRICQEEDEEHDMEAPCACSGTLKFAHRKCIQKWCNKKGDITCEICNQVFSPNYTRPPARPNPDVMAIDIRQAWSPHVDLRDPRFLAFAAAEHQFMQSGYDDYAVANSGSFTCFRSVAVILMLILLIHQVLMVTRDFGMVQESSTVFNVSILQLAGFLLPCYVMARTCYIMHCRRRRQE